MRDDEVSLAVGERGRALYCLRAGQPLVRIATRDILGLLVELATGPRGRVPADTRWEWEITMTSETATGGAVIDGEIRMIGLSRSLDRIVEPAPETGYRRQVIDPRQSEQDLSFGPADERWGPIVAWFVWVGDPQSGYCERIEPLQYPDDPDGRFPFPAGDTLEILIPTELLS